MFHEPQFLSSHTDSPQESNKSVVQESSVNLEPITDTALASWCHSQGCIIQHTLLNQHPNVFLFVKTPKLFECLSLCNKEIFSTIPVPLTFLVRQLLITREVEEN